VVQLSGGVAVAIRSGRVSSGLDGRNLCIDTGVIVKGDDAAIHLPDASCRLTVAAVLAITANTSPRVSPAGTARAAKSLLSACTGKEKRRAMATKTSARRMFPDLQEYVMLQER